MHLISADPCNGPCGKQVSPHDLLPIGPHVRICYDCYAWHLTAMAMLSGKAPPPGCQMCERSLDTLKREQFTDEPKMYLHPLEGLYAVLCFDCSQRYEQLVRERYKNTPYGCQRRLN